MDFENCASYGEIVEVQCMCIVEGVSEGGDIARMAPEEATSKGQDQAVISSNLLYKPTLFKAMHPEHVSHT